ncbi:MAG: CIA30 family protein [Phycisphaerae bacterium]|nr:CIA30 family protein [Phycisphaerae bacterium]
MRLVIRYSRYSRYSVTILTLWTLFFGGVAIATASEPLGKILFDFSERSAAQKWISVNDSVMGGISEGGFRITDGKTLEFSGNLSLENRGGFTSIRSKPTDLNLDKYDQLSLRLKGDGRTYFVNLMTSSDRSASSYRAPVKTQKDTWQEVQINLKDFVFTSFGRVIPGIGPVKAKDIQSIGLTLSDKKPGSFQLELSWIKAEMATSSSKAEAQSKDIVDTAVATGTFKTLVAAVKAAGLVDALKGQGPLTVFAPTDQAFAKLPKGTVEDLLKPENKDKLIAVLSYHVVSGEILLAAQTPRTLQGKPVKIQAAGSFQVNDAKVITSDIITSNGVIHVIDMVLLPPAEKSTSEETAREVIELAISRGVPVFNAGQPSACAAIYEVTVSSLLKSHTNALGDEERSILEDALSKASRDDDPSQKAWGLRRALDEVYRSLAVD